MVLKLRDKIGAEIAGVEDRWLLVQPMQIPHHFQAESVFVRPVLVDGGLADPGAFGDHWDGHLVAAVLGDELLDGGLDRVGDGGGAATRPFDRVPRAHELTVVRADGHHCRL